MASILKTSVYQMWIDSLRDRRAVFHVTARVNRLLHGNAGDARPVDEGVSEMRIHYGPGYRVYYKSHGDEIIILLAGGDKKTQKSDIKTAKRLAASC